jgi:capsular polysaccharide export protein
VPREEALRHADLVVDDLAVGACLAVANEVHTLTSLVGFEALLRGLDVYVYGHPFYAGWGLTIDRHPHARRDRKLRLDELVAGTLIHYPRYVHPKTHELSTPEAIVDYLVALRESPIGPSPLRRIRNVFTIGWRATKQLFERGSRAT